ncbi:hypothetical protein, partial [Streptomyces sp. CHA3]|uniref:hypothetical protein n=1 Tax=Streptomyces sp. CHA3 TaxID=2841669 RepID=UPI0020951C9B
MNVPLRKENPAPAGTERLPADAVRTGEPFTVLYGPGVGDVFVDATGEVRTMEQALWHMLRAAGFERIAFSTWAFALSRTTAGRMGATTYAVPALV